jgi:hypothetical protein
LTKPGKNYLKAYMKTYIHFCTRLERYSSNT